MMRTQTAPKSESVRGGIQIQSVSRALEILNCFMGTDELGISELSAEMGLHKSTVFGLVMEFWNRCPAPKNIDWG